jgi:hypothetical protein
MVNCLNVEKYILSIVSENFAVSDSQEVSELCLFHAFYTFLTLLSFLSCYSV